MVRIIYKCTVQIDKVSFDLIKDLNGCCMCSDNQFLCQNKKCIPDQWKCNGVDDCGDQSDESSENCKGKIYNIKKLKKNKFHRF